MNATLLKIIALLTMTLDHAFKIFSGVLPGLSISIPGQITLNLTAAIACIGRVSFPIFAFFTAEGCRRTANRRFYIRRLFLFALISEIPFDLALMGRSFLTHQNVLFTLGLGVLSSDIYEMQKQRHCTLAGLLPVLCLTVLAELTRIDYGGFGVLLVFILYLCPEKNTSAAAMLGMILLYYARQFPFSNITPSALLNWGLPLLFTALSVPLILCYNGQRGRGLKQFFYIYYPAHLLFLYAVNLFLT